ncbi:MAG: hypothetical protein HRT35_37205 [Algicola sp.]|nr:hypothetical protein [Algicola sp.]
MPLKAHKRLEKNLDFYRSERHRQLSRLLHCRRFLGVPFAELTQPVGIVPANMADIGKSTATLAAALRTKIQQQLFETNRGVWAVVTSL